MSLIIPGSIANYVTGVSERSQRTCGEDHDAKITLLHPTRLAESPPEFFIGCVRVVVKIVQFADPLMQIGETNGFRIDIRICVV